MVTRGDQRVRSASFGVTLLDVELPAPIGCSTRSEHVHPQQRRPHSQPDQSAA